MTGASGSFRLLARATIAAALGFAAAAACGGSDFTAIPATDGGGDAATDGPSTQGRPCSGPEDCRDDDPCTTELCTNSRCEIRPLCGGGQRCCAGACAECCGNADCNDSIECTQDTCTSGRCTHPPD